jgi:hypothetical protein
MDWMALVASRDGKERQERPASEDNQVRLVATVFLAAMVFLAPTAKKEIQASKDHEVQQEPQDLRLRTEPRARRVSLVTLVTLVQTQPMVLTVSTERRVEPGTLV